jgi:outer membrane protein assembly factor BamB
MKTRATVAAAAVVIAVTMSWAGPSAHASGTLTMTGFSPTSGPVGTVVTITGTGFVAKDIVRFNGTTAVVSGVNGAATALTTSEPYAATTGIITVTDPTTGQTVGLPNSPFTVTRGIFPSPRNVWRGGHLTLFGSALSPGRSDPIGIGTLTVGQVTTDRFGNFQIGVSVPWSLTSGQWQIWVLDPIYNKIISVIFVLGDWPQYRHDNAHTGLDTFETSLSTTSVSKLKQLWALPAGGSEVFTMVPSVANGLVYEGDNQSGIGDLWSFTTAGTKPKGMGYMYPGLMGPEPAVANGFLYVVTYNSVGAHLSAMKVAGVAVWDRSIGTVGGTEYSSPVVAGNSVYVGSLDGNLYAFNASTGVPVWTFAAGGAIHSSPAVSGGIVYVGSQNGTLWAINATTGKKVWSVVGGGAVESSPAVVGGVVYVGFDNSAVGAFNASTGAKLWLDTFGITKVFKTSPAVANGVVYIGDNTATSGELWAFTASTGATKWVQAMGAGITDPAVANGVVYCASATSNLVRAMDASTGVVLWHTTSVTAPLAPVISNGLVFLEGGNVIFAFSL